MVSSCTFSFSTNLDVTDLKVIRMELWMEKRLEKPIEEC